MGELIHLSEHIAQRKGLYKIRGIISNKIKYGHYASIINDLLEPLEDILEVNLNYEPLSNKNEKFYSEKWYHLDRLYKDLFDKGDISNFKEDMEKALIFELLHTSYNSYINTYNYLIERKENFNEEFNEAILNYHFNMNIIRRSYNTLSAYLSNNVYENNIRKGNHDRVFFIAYTVQSMSKELVDNKTKTVVEKSKIFKYIENRIERITSS